MSNALRWNVTLDHLPVYQPGRPITEVARELGLAPEALIKLASNENSLGPSPAAMAALQRAIAEVHLYPDGNAYYLKRRLGAHLDLGPDHLILGNGSNEILELVGHALLRPGVDAVVAQYCFVVYPIVTRLFGANLLTVPARDFAHDIPAMLEAITPNTSVVFVANPNNPTGTLAPAADIERLIHQAPEHVLIVMDEAYFEYLDRPQDLLPLVRNQSKPNLLLVRTFSKIYGLAGLRIGYGIGHPDVIRALEKVREPFNVNSLAQAAAEAALDDAPHVIRTRDTNRAGLRYLESEFRRLNLTFVPSQANFILVRVGRGQQVFEALQQRGVITRPMQGYGLPEWLRISVGTPGENQRCVEALTP